MSPTLAVHTLGCKANQFDSATLLAELSPAYRLVPFTQTADAYLINSCTVTRSADAQCRQAIRQARRRNPDAVIVVAGCYAETEPEELAGLEVDYIVGNACRAKIPALFKQGKVSGPPQILRAETMPEIQLHTPPFPSRTRVFFKIQDGCDSTCAYCIVPRARGRNRSLPPNEVLAGLEHYRRGNAPEAVLTGIHLSQYGRDLNPPSSLTELLRRIEERRPVPRLRLSSLEPQEIPSELIALISGSRIICPHLHLPLQTLDDGLLRNMGRRYTAADGRRLIEELKAGIPDLCLGADLITGLPGESEEIFSRSFELLMKLPLDYLHVFPYSPRAGTRAATMPHQVPPAQRKERMRLLRAWGEEQRLRFRSGFIGRELPVLIERAPAYKPATGLSRNYIPFLIPAGTFHSGEEVILTMTGLKDGKAVGEYFPHL